LFPRLRELELREDVSRERELFEEDRLLVTEERLRLLLR
jgi:hypothetical protein